MIGVLTRLNNYLWGHVRFRAAKRRAKIVVLVLIVEPSCEAEVRQNGSVVISDKHVLTFEIAMREEFVVHVLKRRADLMRPELSAILFDLAILLEDVQQIALARLFHEDVSDAVLFGDDIIDFNYIRML